MGLRSVLGRSKSGIALSKSFHGNHSIVDASDKKKQEMMEKFLKAHNGKFPQKMSIKEQLRARSFARKELAANKGLSKNMKSLASDEPEGEENEQETIERLQADVERLTDKCSSLESQNILVAVQQLDILARVISLVLSLTVLYCYWKLVLWGRHQISLEMLLPMQLIEEYIVNENQFLLDMTLQILRHDYFSLLVQAIFFVLPYIYNQRTHGSMHRRFQVFCIAFIIVGRIRLCRWREQTFVQSGVTKSTDASTIPRYGESCTESGIWEANYEISARFMYLSILRLRGLWTKTAQYLSSRADFVPVSYIRELSKLQDQTRATPYSEIKKLLPSKLVSKLTNIEETPLASASIGQVHIASLDDKEKVVVKCQHPHARTLLTDDFWSLKVLCKIIAWMEPEYVFMEILMREWATEARKELSFENEAEHLKLASQALESLQPTPNHIIYTADGVPFQVEVPLPMEELSDQNVLVMNFCEGCRVDDFEQLEQWGLDRAAIMDGISQAFAHFMYCSNIFNGDPHPGNILVRPGTKANAKEGFTLVVLDWGLAKKLPEQKRLAFCQMVYAAATLDYGLLLDSYKTVGLKMKKEDAGQSMEDMRFFLRDMAPREETRKRIKSKMKADKARLEKSADKVPMESKAYPGEFFFFIRVNELLHGLGGSYSVNLGYLDALKPYAERGLRSSSIYDTPLPKKRSSAVKVQDKTLQQKLKTVLKDLEANESLVGAQICVLDKGGVRQADVVAGNLGGLKSHSPMTRDAVVLGYSTTKAVTATLAHLVVQEGLVDYDEPVCKRVWKDFCPTLDPPANLHEDLNLSEEETKRRWQWKRQITLRHILNHTAGLYTALPKTMTVKRFANCEDSYSAFEFNVSAPQETLLPTIEPGEKCEYHYLSFGWLVSGTLCGAWALKHDETRSSVTFEQIYKKLLEPRLSHETTKAGFYPMGGYGDNVVAQTATSDVRASKIVQMRREASVMMEGKEESGPKNAMMEALEGFKGKEFLVSRFSMVLGL